MYTSSVGNITRTVFNPEAAKAKTALSSPTAVSTASFVVKMEAIKRQEELRQVGICWYDSNFYPVHISDDGQFMLSFELSVVTYWIGFCHFRCITKNRVSNFSTNIQLNSYQSLWKLRFLVCWKSKYVVRNYLKWRVALYYLSKGPVNIYWGLGTGAF